MVRLQLINVEASLRSSMTGLNSTMVRLQLICINILLLANITESQFHYGSITTYFERVIETSTIYGLNSTMVRLQLQILLNINY